MSAATHPFPGRDPHQVPHMARGDRDDPLAELAAVVGSPQTGRNRADVTPIRRGRAGGANDLVVTGSPDPARRRLVVVAVAVALAVVLAAMSGLSGARADGEVPAAAVMTLEDGDTLWGLAEEVTPPGGDVRATVAAIMAANDFSTPTLPVGTPVRVPDLDG